MRGKVLAVALATTCLTPVRAEAGPVVAFATGVFQGFAAAGTASFAFNYAIGAAAGGVIGAGYVVGAGIAAFAATAVGRIVLSVGLSALAQSFQQPPSLPKPAARMANFAQPVSYAQYVYGRTRVGGPLGFTGAQSGRRYYVPIIAAHPIEGIVQHWIDEWTCGTDATVTDTDQANIQSSAESGAFSAPAIVGTGQKKAGRIDTFLGQSGQTANAGLVAQFTEVTSDYDFAGLAGAVIWARKVAAERFGEIYPRSREWGWAPVVDGWNEIYDPRDESTGYSDNAALIIAHWIVNVLGGAVDWDDVAVEADAADVTVTDLDGIERPKWTLGGVLSDDQPFETQRGQLAGACDAFFYERTDGKIGFKVGRWIEPTVTLTDDSLSIELTEGQWGADAPSEVSVIYTEPDNAWREMQAGVWVEDATARRVRDEPELFFITNHNQAARMAKRIAKSRRPRYRLRGSLGLVGYELIGQRFFTLQSDSMGVTQTFEVGTLTRVGLGQFEIEAVSADAADFEFDASTEEPARPALGSVDSDLSSPDIAGVTATANSGSSITVGWTAQPDYLWQQIRWRASAATEWQSETITDADQTEFIITGLNDGTAYEIQARNVQSGLASNPSGWLPDPALEVTAVANSTPPNPVTSLSLAVTGSDIEVSFTAPNDPNYFGTRIWRGTSAVFAAATLVRTEYGIPSSGDSWTDTGLAPDTYYYWAAAINASGVEGFLQGPESDTVT